MHSSLQSEPGLCALQHRPHLNMKGRCERTSWWLIVSRSWEDFLCFFSFLFYFAIAASQFVLIPDDQRVIDLPSLAPASAGLPTITGVWSFACLFICCYEKQQRPAMGDKRCKALRTPENNTVSSSSRLRVCVCTCEPTCSLNVGHLISLCFSPFPALQPLFNPLLESISPRCNYFALRSQALMWFSCLAVALKEANFGFPFPLFLVFLWKCLL